MPRMDMSKIEISLQPGEWCAARLAMHVQKDGFSRAKIRDVVAKGCSLFRVAVGAGFDEDAAFKLALAEVSVAPATTGAVAAAEPVAKARTRRSERTARAHPLSRASTMKSKGGPKPAKRR